MIPKADRMSFAVFTRAKRVIGQKPRQVRAFFSAFAAIRFYD